MSLKETVSNPYSKWLEATGPENDVIISSRVRLARNLMGYPFPHVLGHENADKVLYAVQSAVAQKSLQEAVGNLELSRMTELSSIERQILVEKHLISPDMLEQPEKRGVVLRDDEVISIMVNEEDHLRIQCLLPGLQLKECWDLANTVDDGLEQIIDYAFAKEQGYLTSCPTNIGTGLRASVMLHLPALVMTRQINAVLTTLSKLGLTVRGLYGEGTQATGNLFQVSNQVTLGLTEEEIIDNLITVALQLVTQERAARRALHKEQLHQIEDKVWRAYGLLKYARTMTSNETMTLLSDMRLGVDLGVITGIPPGIIMELIILSRPAFLSKVKGADLNPYQRDIFRATLIRERLNSLSNE
ncbi:ATP:guanido phosphotransferase [Desulforamulus reducens MI-1]|uniref:Protein-arginine kinase n=1 Tax=Desulforamulus reducens (strain ATCC BAA-1160 / DSM 100696 / MI-1) TaxID=349161 RepID=MCSB_DESRM|nr:protein arginine kinase [Desulforamulus reducens]A4J0X5.1 RecName: Full=Protein-arginine kinase [Desulforamulus reducens MI-1]ABO48728.1 ATP:guanido phosphotransferase [Desulforamulus reducens MI-1]